MIELEVYAAGLRDLNKILDLDREIKAIFKKLGLDPCFIGAIPLELRLKTKTQPLNV
jgi:hypothetical protein